MSIEWMDGDALELHRVERRIIQIRPGGTSGRTRRPLPQAAVVSGVDIAGPVKEQRMIVGMQTVTVGSKRGATINRLSHQTTACARGLAANIDDAGVIG